MAEEVSVSRANALCKDTGDIVPVNQKTAAVVGKGRGEAKG